jgi:AAA domain/Homeodomain-like domain
MKEHILLTAKKRLEMELPKQKLLLSPWLLENSLNMIYAWRGVGKTHVALEIACAVASGGKFLNWRVEEPKGVIYIDGEMPPSFFNQRLENIVNNMELYPEKLWILGITHDVPVMPDLGTIEGQNMIDRYVMADTKLIIIDNLSCLVRSGARENEAESWRLLSEWALKKRAAGISIIFIHHSGKDGAQRGTSKREDILDTVISLKHPHDYEPSQGARFEVHFEKCRHLYGEDVKPFTVSLDRQGNNYQWQTTSLHVSNKQQIIEMHKDGLKSSEIASQLRISRQAVCKHLKRAKEENFIG